METKPAKRNEMSEMTQNMVKYEKKKKKKKKGDKTLAIFGAKTIARVCFLLFLITSFVVI